MIAEVIVDISSSEVDRIFDYLLDGVDAVPGHRVLVPFSGREIEGYIINIKEVSEVPENKLKGIIRLLDDKPVITAEMLALMDFMRSKYHLRIIDVLRLFIPAEMRGGRVKELKKQHVSISGDYAERDPAKFIKSSAAAQMSAFEYVRENGGIMLSALNKECSASAVRNLISRGIFTVSEIELSRTPYKSMENGSSDQFILTPMQKDATDSIISSDNTTFLLHGVTGSGKTEVYLSCIKDAISKGKTAIMLVPEISLTPQILRVFRSRLGSRVAILHSGLSSGERFDEWRRLLSGDAVVAIGARSAVFAPVIDPGIIIIDEEHDSSYSSESNPRYFTHEVAEFRKRYSKCNIVLGSATPSVESYFKASKGEYKLISLPERINKKALPEISVINMCNEVYDGNNSILSRKLEDELHKCMEEGNQAIIFINRRGYSSYVMCRSCGYVAKCADCDVSLVYHKEENVLKCHYCSNRYSMFDVCPECKSPHIKRGFVGTQKVTEALAEMFPGKKILRMDNDTTQGKEAHFKILSEFAQKKASILVGTQMIAKGHDFPDVTLVGIVDADLSLYFADFRSSERTYQLITQVSGRAGRDQKPGKVVLQTYSPGHYVYRFAVKNDYKGFYAKESNLREVTKYPPFSKIIRILISSIDEQLAVSQVKAIFEDIKAFSEEYSGSFAFLSAMKAPVKRIQTKYRMQILLRITDNYDKIIDEVYGITDKYAVPKITCFVEINPNNLS